MLAGNNGILTRAGEAKNNTEKAQIQEEIQLAWNGVQIGGITERWDNEIKRSELENELKKLDKNTTVSLSNSNMKVIYKGYKTTINISDESILPIKKVLSISGLYDENDNLIKSWKQLKDENIIRVTEGELSFIDEYKDLLIEITSSSDYAEISRLLGMTLSEPTTDEEMEEWYQEYQDKMEKLGDEYNQYVENRNKYFESKRLIVDKEINKIGDYGMLDMKFSSIEMPSVTTVSERAFAGVNIDYIELPSVTTVGDWAFSGCITNNIELPNVTTIGNHAFNSCGAANIELPSAINVGDNVFSYCYNLTSLNLPNAITIGNFYLGDCNKLKSINLSKATITEEKLFQCCGNIEDPETGDYYCGLESLEYIYMPNTDGAMYEDSLYKGRCSFNGCVNLKTIEIPSSVTEDIHFELCDCKSLKEIRIHKPKDSISVTIGGYGVPDSVKIEWIE